MQFSAIFFCFVFNAVSATFWGSNTNTQIQEQQQKNVQSILDGIDVVRNQNIHLKALTLSVLDLLIDTIDDLTDSSVRTKEEKTKVLNIARSISRKHRREASVLPWPASS
jgi:hypothetical protein